MTKIHRFLAMVLVFCLSFQVAASTLTELCRFDCEQTKRSALIKTGSVSTDEVVSTPGQGIREVTWTVRRDDQAQPDMNCDGCSSCQNCMLSHALLPSFNPQIQLFKGHLELLKMEYVSMGEPERPFKPPRYVLFRRNQTKCILPKVDQTAAT